MINIENKNIWCFSAHADDETLGCGGAIHKLSKTNEIWTTTFTNGVGARYLTGYEPIHKPSILRSGEANAAASRVENQNEAGKILGIKSSATFIYLDNMMDQCSTLSVAKNIEETCLKSLDPDIVFTHFRGDLNVDHQKVSEATYVALRPQPGQRCKLILEYSVASSTEYSVTDFNPNFFIELSKENADAKIEAFKQYEKESREFPHPRSPKAILNQMMYWGSYIGAEYAEPFVCRRAII